MNSLFEHLPAKARRGSKPRCHGITHGAPATVAARLTRLIAPFGSVSPDDRWMPQGFIQTDEAELHKAIRLLGQEHCALMRHWWFAIFKGGLQTGPSFDIASTCTVTVGNERKSGILLVEAKAYDNELIKEEKGKPLSANASAGEQVNHDRIGEVIGNANEQFAQATGLHWALSRDSHYQMSNRFASACKLTELGYPVILVYLAFLNANEMRDLGKPLGTSTEWQALVIAHSAPVLPESVWDRPWTLRGQPFIPLIRELDWPLE